jgi:hypothetical protein
MANADAIAAASAHDPLISFIFKLPLKDDTLATRREAVLQAVRFRRRQSYPVEEFLVSLVAYVDFTKMSPLALLIRISLISHSDRDGDPRVLALSTGILAYFSIICEIPEFIDPDYTYDRLVRDFEKFLISSTCSERWIAALQKYCPMNDTLLLVVIRCVQNIADKLQGGDVRFKEVFMYVATVEKILRLVAVRELFAQDAEGFQQFLNHLFSRSLCPGLSWEYETYFGTETGKGMTEADCRLLDDAIGSYHKALIALLGVLWDSPTSKAAVYQWMGSVLRRTDWDPYHVSREPIAPDVLVLSQNFESVLLHFFYQEVNRAHIDPCWWCTIDPLAPHLPGSVVKSGPPLAVRLVSPWVDEEKSYTYETFISKIDADDPPAPAEAVEAEWQSILATHDKPVSDITQLFFVAANAVSNGSHHQVQAMFRMEESRYRRYINFFLILPSRVAKIQEFLLHSLEFLLWTAKYSGRDWTIKWPPVPFQRLPEAMAAVPCEILHIFAIVERYRTNNQVLGRQMLLLGQLFGNRRYLKNPIHRFAVVRMFSAVASFQEHQHLIVMRVCLEEAFPSVIQLYWAAEVTGTANQYYEKEGIRRACLHLIKIWFRFPLPRSYFLENWRSPDNKDFLMHVAKDTLDCADHVVTGFKKLEEQRANQVILGKLRDELSMLLNQAISWGNLLAVISDFAEMAFAENDVPGKVPDLILFVFHSFLEVRTLRDPAEWSRIPRKSKKHPYWVAADFLVGSVVLATRLGREKRLVGFFLNATADLYAQMEKFVCALPPPSGAFSERWTREQANFKDFVAMIERERSLTIPEPDNWPPEFDDPVMSSLMRNPVRLPQNKDGSYTWVDKSTVAQLNSALNPVTGAPYDPSDVVDDLELKGRIDAWFEDYERRYKAEHT